MAHVFEEVTGSAGALSFQFNGQFALKNYNVEIVNGNRLKVVSTANEMFSLLEADISEVEINGVIYSDPNAAQIALTSLVHSDAEPVVLTKEQYMALAAAAQGQDRGTIAPNTATPTGGWQVGWYKPTTSSASPGTNYPNQGNQKAISGFSNKLYYDGTTWLMVREKFDRSFLPQFADLQFPVTNTATEKVQCVDNFVPYQLLDGKTSTSANTPSTSPTIWKSLDSRNLRIYEDLPNGTILNPKEQVISNNVQYIVLETAVVGTDFPSATSVKFKAIGEVTQNITNITQNITVDTSQIVPSEALYYDNDAIAVDIIKRVDPTTGEDVNYRETTTWHDGSVMTDVKTDGVIYIKKGVEYYKRQFEVFFNVKWFGAKGDGVTNDIKAINNAVDYLDKIGGGTLFFPKGIYVVDYAVRLRSNITYDGESKFNTIIKSSATSPDNVIGEGYPVYEHWADARAVGGNIDRLKKPDFLSNYSEEEAYINGGMAGFARVNVKITNLTIDGNKYVTPESSVNLRGIRTGDFLNGEVVTSTNGATAKVGGAFNVGGNGFTLEPSTIVGSFNIGDTVTGQISGATILVQEKWADDAFQMGIRFDGVSHSEISDCIVTRTVFTGISVYNASNNNLIKNNIVIDCNKEDAIFPYGNMGIFIEFDARGNIVKGNIVKGGQGYGILVQSTGGGNEDTQIINNKVFDNRGDGIRVGNETSNSEIVRPVIKGNYVRGVVSNSGVGIRVFHLGSGKVIDAIVSENIVEYSYAGIIITGNVDVDISNNALNGNISNSIGSSSTGSVKIRKNTIKGSDYSIRLLTHSDDSFVNEIVGNIITDFNVDGIFIGAENSAGSLYLGEVSYNKITNTTGANKVGIRVMNNGTGKISDFDIFRNYVENVDYGIINLGSAMKRSLVTKNIVKNAISSAYSSSNPADEVVYENNVTI